MKKLHNLILAAVATFVFTNTAQAFLIHDHNSSGNVVAYSFDTPINFTEGGINDLIWLMGFNTSLSGADLSFQITSSAGEYNGLVPGLYYPISEYPSGMDLRPINNQRLRAMKQKVRINLLRHPSAQSIHDPRFNGHTGLISQQINPLKPPSWQTSPPYLLSWTKLKRREIGNTLERCSCRANQIENILGQP